mgnify:CR=1 FL=1
MRISLKMMRQEKNLEEKRIRKNKRKLLKIEERNNSASKIKKDDWMQKSEEMTKCNNELSNVVKNLIQNPNNVHFTSKNGQEITKL